MAIFSLRERFSRNALARTAIFSLWFICAVIEVLYHAPWRDEVRALSIALQGDSWIDMLRQLHGEGHPAVWYLALRFGYVLTNSPLILPALGFAFAAVVAAELAFLSPFPAPMVALLLAGLAFAFEFPVVARNYGVGVMFIFALAALYRRHSDRGLVLGLLLAALANCNVPGVIVAGAFTMFWGLDTLERDGWQWTPTLRTWFANALVAAVGAALAFATVYPTYQDAALRLASSHPLGPAIKGIFAPAASFMALITSDRGALLPAATRIPLIVVGSTLLFAACLGLVRRPPALVAAVVSLVALSVFFQVIIGGSYRHEATWFAFLIALYWVAWRDVTPFKLPLQRWGAGALIGLAAIQIIGSVLTFQDTAVQDKPYSNSRNVALLVRSRPDLADAVIISDADYMLESLPYYLRNPTYFVHENRFGRVTRFSRQFSGTLSLGQLLQKARDLRRNAPVLILLSHPLETLVPDKPIHYGYGYNWIFIASAANITKFRDYTDKLAEFRSAIKDETYDVYEVKLVSGDDDAKRHGVTRPATAHGSPG